MTFGVLTLIVGCGLVGPLLSAGTRLAVPVVVGEIAAGVVVGQTGMRLLPVDDPTLVFLSSVGFAMLMFVVGTHLPLRDPGLRTAFRTGALAAAASFAVAAPTGYALARWSGIDHVGVFLLLLSASSAAVVLPIVGERGLTGGRMLEITAWVAIVDTATIVALPLALEPSRALRIVLGGIVVAGVAALIFVVARRLRHEPAVHSLRRSSKRRAWAFDLRVSLFALFGLAAIATRFGTSILVAGFAAGMVVALAGEPKRLARQLLGVAEGFLVPFFFVALGAKLDFRALAQSPRDIAVMLVLAAAIVACHLVVAVGFRLGWPAGLLASAQLGLPAGVVSLGLSEGLLEPGQGAAIVAAALLSLAACALGAAMLSRSQAAASGEARAASARPA